MVFGVIVPLDKGLPEEEIEMSIKKAKVEMIFCEENYVETIKKIIDKGETSLKEVVTMDEVENVTTIKNLIKKGEDLINKGDRRYLDAKINAEEMATIVFTSGTTSLSKAVMLSHKNIVSNINSMSKVEWLTETDTNIAFLPYHHTFGSTGQLLYLSKGMKNVFCDGLRHIQENLKEYKVTVFICVPLLIESMYKKIETAIEKKGKTNVVKLGKILTKTLLLFGIDIRRKVFKEVLDELRRRVKIYSKWCICS